MEDLTSLVGRAQRGHADAREELVRRFQDMAVGFAHSVLGDFHLAEDASQDAFVAALSDLGSLRTPEAFPPWFRRVLYKHCDRLLRRTREVPLSPASLPEPVSTASSPVERLEQSELESWLLAALRALPEEERMVTSLFYMGDYTHQQISSFLEIPLATVNNRLRSARKRLEKGILDMAKKGLRKKAPSRDNNFLNLVGLRSAIDANDVVRVRTLVDERSDLLLQHHGGLRPLNDAAIAGHPEIVQILLEAGADPTFDHYVPRPEEQAHERGHQDVVRVFERFSARQLGTHPEAAALCRAIRDKDDGSIHVLLDVVPLDRTDEDGRTPLHRAVETRRQDLVRELLDRGASVDLGNHLAPRPLLLTLDRQDPDLPMARLLIDRGARYDLYAACCLGDLDVVQRLVSESGYPTPPADRPLRPVHFTRPYADPITGAARGGHTEVVSFLLERAGDSPAALFGEEAFSVAGRMACRAGALETLAQLLDAGLDPDGPTKHLGSNDEVVTMIGTPLYHAAAGGHLEICRLLLERGATPDPYLESTGTPLQIAYANGHREVIEVLESQGAVPPISHLAMYGGPDSLDRIAERLRKEAGCDGALPRQGPNSVLSHCAGTGRVDVVQLILDFKPEIDPYNPLHAACCRRGPASSGDQFGVIRLLLEYGADAQARSPADSSYGHGMTMLHHLARGSLRGYDRRADVTDLLLEFGADIEARDDDRQSTPLGWAAAEDDREMVELLLERGASVARGEGKPETTPLYWARVKGHEVIAELLMARGATE